jgi:hypothetical protein
MSSNNCIIPECYIDSCLTEVLLVADRNHVNHQKGNGTVVGEMKSKFENDFCVGVIDEDGKKLDYLEEFRMLTEGNYLKLWKHQTKNHYMIQLRPVMEKWIITICDEFGIDLRSFGLPDKWGDLVRISKSVTSKRDQRFVRLFKEMKRREIKPILKLQDWLKYLNENKYNVDINRLING